MHGQATIEEEEVLQEATPAAELLAMDPREVMERELVDLIGALAEDNERLGRMLEYVFHCLRRQQQQINHLERKAVP
jgi:hypothetical protein